MIKFLNRPLLALAAGLGIIFVIILFRTYVLLANDIPDPEFQEEDVPSESISSVLEIIPISFGSSSESDDSKMDSMPPEPSYTTTPEETDTGRPITLGTFEALNGTCFMKEGQSSIPQGPDEFSDLQNAIDGVNRRHQFRIIEQETPETLGPILDMNNSYENETNSHFSAEISRYRLYSPDSDAVRDILYDMMTQPIRNIREPEGDGQFKLRTELANGAVALLKPKRMSREEQAEPNQIPSAEYERHTSEIAAYHLDRVLGFYRAPPTIGRNINMVSEMLRIAEPKLQRSFFISPEPAKNICFTGNCTKFCDSFHPICGEGMMIEASLSAYLPESDGAKRQVNPHPWKPSDDQLSKPDWEINPDYCKEVKLRPEFSSGRSLLELMDLSIFDFLTGNMDRQNYQQFQAFANNSFVVSCDHGRAFGRAFHDELKILAPMLQCCMIKQSTLKTLLDIHNGDQPLSERMRNSMLTDPIAPVLWEPYLNALDRRMVIVLRAVRDCISRNAADDVIIASDNVNFN